MPDWIAGIRYAARTLRKSRVFAAVAVLSLALGIGNTAIGDLRQHPHPRRHDEGDHARMGRPLQPREPPRAGLPQPRRGGETQSEDGEPHIFGLAHGTLIITGALGALYSNFAGFIGLKMRVRCGGVGFTFDSGGQRIVALRNLTFESRESEFLSIIGPSGCGKTTLLRAVSGLVRPSEGNIEHIAEPGNGAGRAVVVYQENSLFPWMTVLENAAYGLKTQGVARAERESRARDLLDRYGLAGRENSYPHALSVGMKQRVAVIRCFLSDPAMLLMDEPFAALDAQTRLTLQQELLSLWEPGRRSVIFVTHDVEEALLLSDRILVMSQAPGRIVAQIQVPFERPRSPATALTSEFLRLKRRIYSELGLEAAVAHA